ncbi:hypothetical protein ABG971_10595, partial [Collinsella aerofaciens]
CPYRRQCAECSPSKFIGGPLQTVMGTPPHVDRSGKYIPFWSQKLGRSFRQAFHPESVSRSEPEFWDALSAEASTGKCIPFRALIPGHGFLRYKTTIRRPYHMPSNMRSRNTKQQIECSFFKKYTSRNLPRLHIQLPFTVADYRPPIQTRNMSPKAGHLPAWLDFGQLLVS